MSNTSAERQARYRARQNARRAELQEEVARLRAAGGAAAVAPEPEPRRPTPERNVTDDAVIARLEARIIELEAELARERAGKKARPEPPPLPSTREELEAAKRAATEERKAKRAEAAAGPKQPKQPAPVYDEAALLAEIARLQQFNKGLLTRIANLRVQVRVLSKDAIRGNIVMSKRMHSAIIACIHPDDSASKERRTKCFQDFSSLAFTLIDEDV